MGSFEVTLNGEAMDKMLVRELIDNLEAEINNGGFEQFFFNSAGDRTSETILALKAIGANHTASIVESAAAMFPDGMPSPDRFKRQHQLLTISSNSDLLESLDQSFYEYREDLAALAESYVN